jgi:hypothetical protein
MQNSNLYQKFIELKIEIEKHKWIESEKIGRDVGFEHALTDWISKYRVSWCEHVGNIKKINN